MKFVGWDWASTSHDVTVLDEQGRVVERWGLRHTEQGLGQALARLGREHVVRPAHDPAHDPDRLPGFDVRTPNRSRSGSRVGAGNKKAVATATARYDARKGVPGEGGSRRRGVAVVDRLEQHDRRGARV